MSFYTSKNDLNSKQIIEILNEEAMETLKSAKGLLKINKKLNSIDEAIDHMVKCYQKMAKNDSQKHEIYSVGEKAKGFNTN